MHETSYLYCIHRDLHRRDFIPGMALNFFNYFNDSTEFLTNPTIQVPESQAVGTEIVPYTAQDPDQTPYGIVSYEINSGKLLLNFFHNVE